MESISLLWTIVSIVVTTIITVLGSVAGAAWWLKGQLTGAELAGVRAENAVLREQAKLHEGYRQWAEAQTKVATEQLTVTQATNAKLEQQIVAGAAKEVLIATVHASSGSVTTANNALQPIVGVGHMTIIETGDTMRANGEMRLSPDRREK